MGAMLTEDVRVELGRYVLTDGLDLVFDLEASQGCWAVDAVSGKRYLDFFSFFASLPLGFNHPCFGRSENRERLLAAAVHKVSNSDAYTEAYASFVRTFADIALPPGFRHLFFIEGGALAVENALKTAFDWKVRRNLAAGRRGDLGSRVLHFREAFHGRTGYTLSLTNTDPVKIEHFPKFDWPRVPNPKLRFPVTDAELKRVAVAEEESLAGIELAFKDHPHDIAAIIIEPIQGEGGDNHFRPEFFVALREIADREDALLLFDEVQTGMGLTGRLWAFEHFGVSPDIVAFGKKTQVCGIMVNDRVDEVPDNVFQRSSRLNSTWGGNLVDMARCEIILRTIQEEGLVEHAAVVGEHLLRRLHEVSRPHDDLVSNVRGRGLMCAFDLPGREQAREVVRRCFDERLIVLPCGRCSVRLRPTLTVAEEEVDHAAEILARVFRAME
jgi:L-lysine 6-transaminase